MLNGLPARLLPLVSRVKQKSALSLQAQIATKFHGLFPGLTADLLGVVNRLLPAADGIGSESAEGKDGTSDLSPSALTTLSDRAAQREQRDRRIRAKAGLT